MTRRTTEELIFRMRTVAGTAANSWAVNFAKSILRQSRKPTWSPSPKQEVLMRQLVEELFVAPGEDAIFEALDD